MEITGSGKIRCMRAHTISYRPRKSQAFDSLTAYGSFLADYPAKSDIIGLIERADCLKPNLIVGYAQCV